MPSGEKRADFARKVGMATFKVAAICPSKDKIKELFGLEEEAEKEPEYTGEKDVEIPVGFEDDGVTVRKETKSIRWARIDMYLRDTKTNDVTKRAYFLWDRPFVKKDLSKQQYINYLGKTAWVDDPANLPEKFTSYPVKEGHGGDSIPFHPAVSGESDLVEFLDTWLTIDKKKAYDLAVDTDNFFRGDFRELQGLVESELASVMCGAYIVRTVESDGGVQFYQDVWKKFVPGFTFKFFQVNDFTPEKLRDLKDRRDKLKEKIRTNTVSSTDWMSNWENFVLDITDNDYGCKDAFSLKPAEDFNPDTHYATRAATLDVSSAEY